MASKKTAAKKPAAKKPVRCKHCGDIITEANRTPFLLNICYICASVEEV